VDTGSTIPIDGVIITRIMSRVEPVPVPGIIVPGMVTGRVEPGAVPDMEIRITVPIRPTVIIPRVVIPVSVRPGPIIPTVIIPGAVPTPVIIVSHIPRPVSPGIVPSPGRGVPNRYRFIFNRERDVLVVRKYQGISGTKDISLGGVGIGQQIIQFFTGWGRLFDHNGRTGVDTVVKNLALKTACGRA
jgi:hypothetical protein